MAGIDAKIRKQLTKFRMHHPKSDVDRLYLPRTDGGCGLNQLEMAYETTLISLGRYLERTTDLILQALLKYEKSKKNSIINRVSLDLSPRSEPPDKRLSI